MNRPKPARRRGHATRATPTPARSAAHQRAVLARRQGSAAGAHHPPRSRGEARRAAIADGGV